MATLTNLSFEAQGDAPGDPYGWTVTTLSSAYELAGYQIAENLALYSEQFDQAGPPGWSTTNASINANERDAPDGYGGDTLADTLVENATAAAYHDVNQTIGGATDRLTISVMVHEGSQSWLVIRASNPSGAAYFDVANGALGSIDSGWAAKHPVVAIEDLGGDWYRCTVSIDAGVGATIVYFGAASGDGGAQYDGASGRALYLFGAQAGEGGADRGYLKTEAATATLVEGVETFEQEWGNEPLETGLVWTELAEYATSDFTHESFDAVGGEWDTAYLTGLSSKADAAYLIEQNLALQSEAFGSTPWVLTNATVSADTTEAPPPWPDTRRADELVDTVATVEHSVKQDVADVAAGDVTVSVYVQEGTAVDWMWLEIVSGGDNARQWFDLGSGVLGSDAGTLTVGEAIIDHVSADGGNWYRCSMFVESVPAGTVTFRIAGAVADSGTTYLGTGAKALILFGAQLVEHAERGPGVETTTAAVETTGTEQFEAWWDNWPLWTETDTASMLAIDLAALYNGGTVGQDTFEASAGWDAAYDTELTTPTLAAYDGASPENYEDFEEVKDRQAFTVNVSADELLATGHGFNVNDRVSVASEGQLPPGLSPSPLYYVQSAPDANRFTVALTASAGSAIDITDYGFDTHWVYADPTLYWTQQFTIP